MFRVGHRTGQLISWVIESGYIERVGFVEVELNLIVSVK